MSPNSGSDEQLISCYITSDASIVYYITVTAAKAAYTQFSTMTRRISNQRKLRVAVREAVVQKKKKKRKNPLHNEEPISRIRLP